MDSDLEIARKATMRPIEEVAEQLGLARSDLVLHGPHIAKVNWEAIQLSLIHIFRAHETDS